MLPPQSIHLYKIVRESHGLTATEAAAKLGSFPNAVYRAARPLLDYGLVVVASSYPKRYVAVNDPDLADKLAGRMQADLRQTLKLPQTGFTIRGVNDRHELLRLTTFAVEKATRNVDFMVSGLEVPADTILAYKGAADRGVRIRALVYQPDETSAEMYRNWRAIGVNVRYCEPDLAARMFVIDNYVCVYTGYDAARGWEAAGQKVTSAPLGELLGALFEEKWRGARPIPGFNL